MVAAAPSRQSRAVRTNAVRSHAEHVRKQSRGRARLCAWAGRPLTRRRSGYAQLIAYDPAKIMPAPPRYQPADDAGPVYDDSDPPTWKDFIKAANRGRKMLKDLKP